MIGDAGEDIGEPGLRVDVVQSRGLDQGVEDGGALTTAVFALMMSRVDRRIAATHYTVIATIEVLGKSPSAWFSGYAATALGYSGVFAAATLLSFAFLALVPRNQNSG